jgi:hypothetical protein
MLNEFYRVCREQQIKVDHGALSAFRTACIFSGSHEMTDIVFAPAWLFTAEAPVPSSGRVNVSVEKGQAWLVEQLRPKAKEDWSSSLDHRSTCQDTSSATIYAFVHFAYMLSNETLVFADVQGEQLISPYQLSCS